MTFHGLLQRSRMCITGKEMEGKPHGCVGLIANQYGALPWGSCPLPSAIYRGPEMTEHAPICKHCGEPETLVPAIGFYCPNDACFSLELEESKRLVNAMRKKERHAQYLKLKEEFGDD